jgi:ferrochelatase
MISKTGVLLTNIGTPDKPSNAAVRKYLKTFLNDKRVVELPRFIWWPILYGIILPFRAKQSAKLYQSIWTNEGSPLLVYSEKIKAKIADELQCPVALGMHYSKPSIQDAFEQLMANNVTRIVILPLYPQYSGTTTGASFDAIANVFRKRRIVPAITTIQNYATNTDYIQAIAQSIQTTWNDREKKHHLLFSYHSIPQQFVDRGDPYEKQCYATTNAIVDTLKLKSHEWSIAFQSRLGKAKWISPYTSDVLAVLPSKGIVDLDVICPGFATDCLETLEEINIRGREQFLAAGGNAFHYIAALNDSDVHIKLLAKIVTSVLVCIP